MLIKNQHLSAVFEQVLDFSVILRFICIFLAYQIQCNVGSRPYCDMFQNIWKIKGFLLIFFTLMVTVSTTHSQKVLGSNKRRFLQSLHDFLVHVRVSSRYFGLLPTAQRHED